MRSYSRVVVLAFAPVGRLRATSARAQTSVMQQASTASAAVGASGGEMTTKDQRVEIVKVK